MASTERQAFVKSTIDQNGVALVEICRPEKRNALSQLVIDDLVRTIKSVEKNHEVRAIVLTGSVANGLFSAGADLSELIDISTIEAHEREWLKDLSDAVSSMRKPIIAAVLGFALGGGFELAMMCDIIYAAKDAKFGLPELSVGTMPGAGGTQRLTKCLGKYKAMEMILTSATMTGVELELAGLVSKVFSADEVLQEAIRCAQKIAERSGPVAKLAKRAILEAEQSTLEVGLNYERSLYYSTFSLHDKQEGMSAFLGKRPPVFKHC